MKKALIVLIVVIVLGAGGYFFFRHNSASVSPDQSSATVSSLPPNGGAAAADLATIPAYQYTEAYADPDYHFSFKYPGDFTVQQIPNDNGKVVIVQNVKTKIGLQIVISTYTGEGNTLTVDMIHQNIPDLQITDPQDLLIGGNTGKGVAFLSDNKDFGGKSREVWFIYNGNLYQISTYADMDAFLKGLFGTWQFSQ